MFMVFKKRIKKPKLTEEEFEEGETEEFEEGEEKEVRPTIPAPSRAEVWDTVIGDITRAYHRAVYLRESEQD